MEKLLIEVVNILTFGLLKKSQKKLIRDEELVLYFFPSCTYCKPVIDAFNRKGVMVEARDIQRYPHFNQELYAGGGQSAVPCLRIEEAPGQYHWLYDSQQIISFINQRY